MSIIRLFVQLLALLAALCALLSCSKDADDDAGALCEERSGPGGLCQVLYYCCDSTGGDCYIEALGERISCGASCILPSVQAEVATKCQLENDGDADTDSETSGTDTDSDSGSEADSDSDSDSFDSPPGHTDMPGGIPHYPGKDDPLNNCVECHGQTLKGDLGRSCYSCHSDDDHDANYHGVIHKSGSRSSCKACHGPNNDGGLGQACGNCH